MLHAEAARGLHHVERADHVGIEIGARVLEAVAHPGLRREVDDHVGRERVRDPVEQRLILQHPLGGGEIRVLQQHLMPALLQADIVIIRHPVIAVNGEPLGQQQLGQVEPDEPGGAGDQDTHQRPTPT